MLTVLRDIIGKSMVKAQKQQLFPAFVPRVQDLNVTKCGIEFPMIIMDSRHAAWRAPVARKIREITERLVIDPATDMLLFKGASEGVNIKRLGYPEKMDVNLLFGEPKTRSKVIETCVADQQSKNADVIIPPYFYADDPNALAFNLNLTMLSETIKYMANQKMTQPIYAYIEIGNTFLTRPTMINMVVDRYLDNKKELSGFLVTINDLDCRKADEDLLFGLTTLIRQLAQEHEVFINYIDCFGEVLVALGASGYSSGLTTGEVFSAKNFQESAKDRRFKKQEKTFVPELLGYLNDEAVKKVNYKCNCSACNGAYPKSTEAKKKHYVLTKYAALEQMQSLSLPQRIDFMKEKLSSSQEFTRRVKRMGVNPKNAWIGKWSTVLMDAANANPNRDDSDLDKFINELAE